MLLHWGTRSLACCIATALVFVLAVVVILPFLVVCSMLLHWGTRSLACCFATAAAAALGHPLPCLLLRHRTFLFSRRSIPGRCHRRAGSSPRDTPRMQRAITALPSPSTSHHGAYPPPAAAITALFRSAAAVPALLSCSSHHGASVLLDGTATPAQ